MYEPDHLFFKYYSDNLNKFLIEDLSNIIFDYLKIKNITDYNLFKLICFLKTN